MFCISRLRNEPLAYAVRGLSTRAARSQDALRSRARNPFVFGDFSAWKQYPKTRNVSFKSRTSWFLWCATPITQEQKLRRLDRLAKDEINVPIALSAFSFRDKGQVELLHFVFIQALASLTVTVCRPTITLVINSSTSSLWAVVGREAQLLPR